MSYTDYKQQYTYGFGPISIAKTFASSSTTFFAGDACGLMDYLSTSNTDAKTLPIDLKAEKQMFSKKALLKVKCLEGFAPCGAKQVVKLTLSSNAGSNGKGTVTIKGETPVEVSITSGDTPAVVAKAFADALVGLKGWDVSYTASNAYFSLTSKEPMTSWTYSDTSNFKFETTATTQTGAWAEVTAGVAPESDTHYLKIDLCSSATAPTETSQKTASGVVPDITFYVHPQAIANQDLFEITMPSTLKRYTWLEVSMPNASSTTMTAGKLLVHFIPNLV